MLCSPDQSTPGSGVRIVTSLLLLFGRLIKYFVQFLSYITLEVYIEDLSSLSTAAAPLRPELFQVVLAFLYAKCANV